MGVTFTDIQNSSFNPKNSPPLSAKVLNEIAALKSFKASGEMVYSLINPGYAVGSAAPAPKPSTAIAANGATINLTPQSFAPYKRPHETEYVFFDGFAEFDSISGALILP